MDTRNSVQIWCMDLWSGRDKGRLLEFKTHVLACAYMNDFNSKNSGASAPEYYEYAELV